MKAWVFSSLRKAAWAPILVFLGYAIAAKVFYAYLEFPWLDVPTHFLGGVAFTYFALVAISQLQALVGSIPVLIQKLLAVGLTSFVAIVWEFWEYACDVLLHTEMNLGVRDTLSDLLFGLLGALLLVSFTRRNSLLVWKH